MQEINNIIKNIGYVLNRLTIDLEHNFPGLPRTTLPSVGNHAVILFSAEVLPMDRTEGILVPSTMFQIPSLPLSGFISVGNHALILFSTEVLAMGRTQSDGIVLAKLPMPGLPGGSLIPVGNHTVILFSTEEVIVVGAKEDIAVNRDDLPLFPFPSPTLLIDVRAILASREPSTMVGLQGEEVSLILQYEVLPDVGSISVSDNRTILLSAKVATMIRPEGNSATSSFESPGLPRTSLAAINNSSAVLFSAEEGIVIGTKVDVSHFCVFACSAQRKVL